MKRKIGLSLVLGAALPLAVASVAWACGVLATVKLDKRVVSPGATVTATGKNYSTSAGASDVTIRLKNRKGTVLASTVPDAGKKIDSTFSLPNNLSPGWYVVLATQENADGTPKSGTPGRTTVRVQGAGAAASKSSRRSKRSEGAALWGSSGNPSAPAGAVAGGGSPSPAPLPTLLAVLLSLTMLAGGWALVSRRSRTVTGPQLGV